MYQYILLLSFFLATTHSANVITVYGDVHQNADFFNTTFPWIIDNIGGEVTVDYYMLGSGKYSVPQMCALQELKNNTFVQAQYLKCETTGYPSEYCLCMTGIDAKHFKQCVATGGFLASEAAAKFAQIGIDFTPVIDLGSNIVYGVDDKSKYLKKICTIYGDNQPRGCLNPFKNQQGEDFAGKKIVAHFDRDCNKDFLAHHHG